MKVGKSMVPRKSRMAKVRIRRRRVTNALCERKVSPLRALPAGGEAKRLSCGE